MSNPISNTFIIGLTVLMYLPVALGLKSIDSFILHTYDLSLLSYGFMHGDFLHLVGNMFYLWLFGNVICSSVGNATYSALFFFLVIITGALHLFIDGSPVIGASGAVYGVIGIYLYLYPKSKICCVWTARWAAGETFSISAYWIIGFWFVKDLFGAIYGASHIAYMAHIGGLLSGMVIGYFMFKHNWIKRDKGQPNLSQVLGGS